ncbi:hypothetical protein [Nitrosococcus wardiae]|uniref:Uncharacterized protein n=1 Tax=Nitrosococcus wardiae TaxID=1814290 RepID=A0A4P7C353_9GAMM|nr:hypothetical protein [Nitrosococcus wardiae]QBQ55984.1 hypothetical protein E3U44_16800 [Nitrosococcus wardiae]
MSATTPNFSYPLKKLGLTIFILWLAVLAWEGSLNEQGSAYIDRIFKQALTTFAVARTLNGIISVAQGTKLAVEPTGVGVNFALGEILDPINDLIERFSWVMLASTTSLGIQKLLLEMTGWGGMQVLLLGSVLLFIARLWLPLLSRWNLPFFIDRLLLLTLFLNLAMPAVASLSSQVFENFIEEKQQASVRVLQQKSRELKQLGESLPLEEEEIQKKNWRDKFSALWGNMRSSLNFEAEIEQLKEKSEEIAEHVVNLIVVFVLQTILLPLVLFWLLLRIIRR